MLERKVKKRVRWVRNIDRERNSYGERYIDFLMQTSKVKKENVKSWRVRIIEATHFLKLAKLAPMTHDLAKFELS